ncbi:uncharacterized protein TA05955 [Theileria annulata]|uniref:t-SNARE coiled-coil homology domain-containing protein n=1 Tax=Theileria annulata TaxID=5874 RepID=Q4UI31_THEAN|nr:uncharacterized protein TA05955 [Theileria annulata]CAI73258.1 hypothetical protein, conserved [Theileria annulata]|eukprot:XP_953935.1 hypothetical protein, conserved [Theileria annulata]
MIEGLDKDPYDEAENKVRKSIRKAILLQSQLYDNTGSLKNDNNEAVRSGDELASVCSSIENDIGELQKVILAIQQNPNKYKISQTLIDSRQQTINEFKSKLNGIVQHTNEMKFAQTNYASDYSNVQLQHQQDVLNQQNYHLNELHGSAQTLHTQAIQFNQEVKSQNILLRDVEEQMTESQLHINTLTRKLSRFLDTDNPSIIRLILTLSIIATILVIVLIVF